MTTFGSEPKSPETSTLTGLPVSAAPESDVWLGVGAESDDAVHP